MSKPAHKERFFSFWNDNRTKKNPECFNKNDYLSSLETNISFGIGLPISSLKFLFRRHNCVISIQSTYFGLLVTWFMLENATAFKTINKRVKGQKSCVMPPKEIVVLVEIWVWTGEILEMFLQLVFEGFTLLWKT